VVTPGVWLVGFFMLLVLVGNLNGPSTHGRSWDAVAAVLFVMGAAAPPIAAIVLCGAAWICDAHWWHVIPPSLVLGLYLSAVVAGDMQPRLLLCLIGVAAALVAFFSPWVWSWARTSQRVARQATGPPSAR
jgi:hypothetical protein